MSGSGSRAGSAAHQQSPPGWQPKRMPQRGQVTCGSGDVTEESITP
jgi:hypothetical protein